MMYPRHRHAGVTSVIVALLLLAPIARAAMTLSLVTSSDDPRINSGLDAALSSLGGATGFQLVERQELARILAEHELNLRGVTRPEDAIRIGALVKADLFAIVETGAGSFGTGSFVVFDTATGARLWDDTIAIGSVEPFVRAITSGVATAVQKLTHVGDTTRTVTVMPFRRINAPTSHDDELRTARALLERMLGRTANITILERSRLDRLLEEQALAPSAHFPKLLEGAYRIEVDVEGSPRGKGEARIRVAVTDRAGQELQARETNAPSFKPGPVAKACFDGLSGVLGGLAKTVPMDTVREADRFAEESIRLRHQDRSTEAYDSIVSAVALNPGGNYTMPMATAQLEEALRRLQRIPMERSDLEMALQLMEKAIPAANQPTAPRYDSDFKTALRRVRQFVDDMHDCDLGVFDAADQMSHILSSYREDNRASTTSSDPAPVTYASLLEAMSVTAQTNAELSEVFNKILLGQVYPAGWEGTSWESPLFENVPVPERWQAMRKLRHPLFQAYAQIGAMAAETSPATPAENTARLGEIIQTLRDRCSDPDLMAPWGQDLPEWAVRAELDAILLANIGTAVRVERLLACWERMLENNVNDLPSLSRLVYAMEETGEMLRPDLFERYASLIKRTVAMDSANPARRGPFLSLAFLLYEKYPQLNFGGGKLPWKEVVTLGSPELDGSTLMDQLFLRPEGAYALEHRMDDHGTVTNRFRVLPSRVSLQPVNVSHLVTETGNACPSCMDSRYFYYGGYDGGFYAFPLDGSKPVHLDAQNGLPRDTIQALAVAGAKVYFALTPFARRKEDLSSYIMSWDPANGQLDYVASTTRREKLSPLDELEGFRVPIMFSDTTGEHILMRVHSVGRNKLRPNSWRLDSRGGDISSIDEATYKAEYEAMRARRATPGGMDGSLVYLPQRVDDVQLGEDVWFEKPFGRLVGPGRELQLFQPIIGGSWDVEPVAAVDEGRGMVVRRKEKPWSLLLLRLTPTSP